ncbi:16S rRNA (cytidine(1402)-2'-O)-methyltransferase [Acetivibrio straminisolvens]|uniref:Ribosomal RNA small subunit methyltransferase I n=1 Tax=Acetivibrio straminisolvens JCM 21531 TaxID=1294263 RepID=W4VBB9_9FIRM|nr:16S rRNA (cytidine(1402)-2'-O)-methyltransferase [Acetivibrio straminisolvens]GAE90098.1 rRNA small subunit methyltransferase I [Acetivibrio straminisolvens JCM 21531]
MSNKGTLYLVATPIGNLEDITLRAIRVLREVDLIAAEDTRQTIKLLNHLDIKKPMVSYYEHNKIVKGNYLVEQLLEGKSIALVSDAGTPGISDPGEDMVKLCIENEIPFTMVPGPVAAVMGLVLSGFSSGRFVFEGFLPMNKRARRERINSLKDEIRTIVFYEAPHKLVYTLKDLHEVLGNRRITLARELTKKYEEVLRCTLEEAVERYESESPRGEYVLVVEGADENQMIEDKKSEWDAMSILEHYQMYIAEGLSKKEAMKKVAQDRGMSKRDVYNALI